MARYRCYTKAFIGGHLLEEGQTFTVSDSFIPGPHLEPLDDAAEAAMDKYVKDREKAGHGPATLHPIEPVEEAQITSIGDAPEVEPAEELTLASASSGKAQPGPTDGGKVKPQA